MAGGGRRQVFTGKRQLALTRYVSLIFFRTAYLPALLQALLGFSKNVTLLDGRSLELVRTGVTQPGKLIPLYIVFKDYKYSISGFVQVIKGEGMPVFGRKGSNGDLFVEYNVVLPVEISSELRRSKSRSLYILPIVAQSPTADLSRNLLLTILLAELTDAFRHPSSTHDEL